MKWCEFNLSSSFEQAKDEIYCVDTSITLIAVCTTQCFILQLRDI